MVSSKDFCAPYTKPFDFKEFTIWVIVLSVSSTPFNAAKRLSVSSKAAQERTAATSLADLKKNHLTGEGYQTYKEKRELEKILRIENEKKIFGLKKKI